MPDQDRIVELPIVCRTRSGIEFDPSCDVWKYRDGISSVRLDFKLIRTPFMFRDGLKRVLAWYAENESPSHLENMFSRFRHFSDSVRVHGHSITEFDLLSYRSLLRPKTEWYLGSLSGLLKRWQRLRIPGITENAGRYLNSIKIKGNPKGVAVLTMDPEHGRFTDIEFDSIRLAINKAFDSDLIGKGHYALALLFIALGLRPAQYAAMKICDIVAVTSLEQAPTYIISVPRAKRRERAPRSSFKKRTLIPSIGRIVSEYASEVRSSFVGILENPDTAPLFPTVRGGRAEPTGFAYHRTARSLGDWFQNAMDKLEVKSERTGRKLNITPTRFRRTLGCRAADEGHGELVIAELLDHTDTQNVGVYVEATSGMIERIDRAVAFRLAPLAQAFAGVVIADESHARRSGDPTSRVCDPRFDPEVPMGSCGEFGFCGRWLQLPAIPAATSNRGGMAPTRRFWTFSLPNGSDCCLRRTDALLASTTAQSLLLLM